MRAGTCPGAEVYEKGEGLLGVPCAGLREPLAEPKVGATHRAEVGYRLRPEQVACCCKDLGPADDVRDEACRSDDRRCGFEFHELEGASGEGRCIDDQEGPMVCQALCDQDVGLEELLAGEPIAEVLAQTLDEQEADPVVAPKGVADGDDEQIVAGTRAHAPPRRKVALVLPAASRSSISRGIFPNACVEQDRQGS
jgi:hypothetical protein